MRTASTSTAEAVNGTHSFKINGYSRRSDPGVGRYMSSTLAAAGHDWRIRYYPRGAIVGTKDYVAVHLDFAGKSVHEANLTVLYDFRLLNTVTRQSSSVFSAPSPMPFSSAHVPLSWGTNRFIKRSDLEEGSEYVQDDRLTLECHVTVIKQLLVVEEDVDVQVPPSDLLDDLRKLMEATEGADVMFDVRGTAFHAHRMMLAARSAVFKAKLYGPMADKETDSIAIDDMEPAIFKAFLGFIYTHSLPAMDDVDGDVNLETIGQLLVAADRYAVERLKLMCEDILCKRLHVDNIAATLALADEQDCRKLKDTCIEFIKKVCPNVFIELWEKEAMSQKS